MNNDNQSGPISTSKFLDFLKLACRVHESIILKDDSGKALDYNALAKNELVNALVNSKSGQSPKSNGNEDGSSNEKNGKFLSMILLFILNHFILLSIEINFDFSDGTTQSENNLGQKWNRSRHSFNEKSPLDTVLTEKLNEVISEGILDSILPFICAANLPLHNDKLNVSHTCGLKTKTNGNAKLLSPRIVVNNGESPGTSKSNNDPNFRSSSKERHQRRKSSQSLGLLSEYVRYWLILFDLQFCNYFVILATKYWFMFVMKLKERPKTFHVHNGCWCRKWVTLPTLQLVNGLKIWTFPFIAIYKYSNGSCDG